MSSFTQSDQTHIMLHLMGHQHLMRQADEDWAGITSGKERKRLQNRLNQRARRQKQKQRKEHSIAQEATQPTTSLEHHQLLDEQERQVATKRQLLNEVASVAWQNYMMRRPVLGQLLDVIQYNTINALTSNARSLNLQVEWLVCDSISPVGLIGPTQPMNMDSVCYPQWLIPTKLQNTVPHHPWIDLFPLPRMRDNLLRATYVTEEISECQEEELWADLVEGVGNNQYGAGLLVWGDAWNPQNWEVTETLLNKWGWLVQGCDELLVATNYWRAKRGEKPLRFL